jgi:AraC-like DNA-binding protein
MAATFEFRIEKGFHFGKAFGERFGAIVENDRVYLPESLGHGFIQEVFIKPGLSICLHRYRLEQQLQLKRLESAGKSDQLTIKFDCRRVSLLENNRGTLLYAPGCEVELGTGNFFTEVSFPVQQEIFFLVINISRAVLLDTLGSGNDVPELEKGIISNPSFLINLKMSREMEEKLAEFAELHPGMPLAQLLYYTKTLEMIYLLFSKLNERPAEPGLSISKSDADKLYEIRSVIISDLSVIPQLPELAKRITMSPTKMKVLFKQVFGDTIYHYFQTARMNEAAKLLKDLSVSETGYRLGFTNMSHFSRLFEKYFLQKPKKFKDSNH